MKPDLQIFVFLILGNKGGVAIRLEYERTSLCFVSSHLAAHTDGTEKRNKDYQEICKNLIFDGLAITDHDMVFWMGDLNYRYRKVASTDASRFVARLVYNHTQKPDLLIRSLSQL